MTGDHSYISIWDINSQVGMASMPSLTFSSHSSGLGSPPLTSLRALLAATPLIHTQLNCSFSHQGEWATLARAQAPKVANDATSYSFVHRGVSQIRAGSVQRSWQCYFGAVHSPTVFLNVISSHGFRCLSRLTQVRSEAAFHQILQI